MTLARAIQKHIRADELRLRMKELDDLLQKLSLSVSITLSNAFGRGSEHIVFAIPTQSSNEDSPPDELTHLVASFPEITREFQERLLRHAKAARDEATKEYESLFSAD